MDKTPIPPKNNTAATKRPILSRGLSEKLLGTVTSSI